MPDSRATSFPAPIEASSADLPPAVAEALERPAPGRPAVVEASGIPFATVEWGDAGSPPLLLIHGVTAHTGTLWRVGPALAAAGFGVVAVDLLGHGRTGAWTGRHRFADTAADIAAFARAAGLDGRELRVVGHSWGALVAAQLPAAGLRPRVLVLVDPPVMPVATMATMVIDPVERRYDDLAEATRIIRAAYPSWSDGDVVAKAEGLTMFDEAAVRAVLLDNGDWDGGMGALRDPGAADVETWVVRGEPASGGLVPDAALPAFAQRIGADHILTIAGGEHSPHRMRPEATVVALLRALRGR
ncbi:MAG TPA: alpha/beta fold hydrolase [Candidatus Limnocylindrales bacterium]|nr:alpha/beta fold hydrolase [Candidatus Limnocylindrales bacterium]